MKFPTFFLLISSVLLACKEVSFNRFNRPGADFFDSGSSAYCTSTNAPGLGISTYRPGVNVFSSGASAYSTSTGAPDLGVSAYRPNADVLDLGANVADLDVDTCCSSSSTYGAAPESVSDLVTGCEYSETFWPKHNGLGKSDWVDHCIQYLGSRRDDLFVKIENWTNNSCTICSESQEGVTLVCSCHNGPLSYCNACLSNYLKGGSTTCSNTAACRKLLPCSVILHASQGGIFDTIVSDSDVETGVIPTEDEVDKALQARDEVPARYLSQLVEEVSNFNSDFKIVTCTCQDCNFQALVEQNLALSVPCYFHPDNRICVQCNANYRNGTDHQCRFGEAFGSVEERRQAHSFPCPNCKIDTQRDHGCMHMTCTQCGHHWCWHCVWHFFGEPGEEHEDKILSYETESEYCSEHINRFHNGSKVFFRNSGLDDRFHPYIKYCNLGGSCPCKRRDNNPFTF